MMKSNGFRTLRLRRKDLEELRDAGKTRDIEMVGLVYADEDVTPDLIEQTLSGVKIYGRVIASPTVRQAIQSRNTA